MTSPPPLRAYRPLGLRKVLLPTGCHRAGGPPACRHPGRTGPPRHPAGVPLPLGRPSCPGSQPARPGHHRRARPGRHHGAGQPVRQRGQVPCLHWPCAKASETGQTDRKGQPISKAGNRLLRTTLVRAADNARRVDLQLARLYHTQMVQRGKTTSVRSVWSPPTWPSAPGRSWTEARPTWSATPTAPQSPPPRPRPSSPSTGPCPSKSAGSGAAGREGPSASPHRTCAWRSKRNEATLPLIGHSWPPTQPRQADPPATLTAKPP